MNTPTKTQVLKAAYGGPTTPEIEEYLRTVRSSTPTSLAIPAALADNRLAQTMNAQRFVRACMAQLPCGVQGEP